MLRSYATNRLDAGGGSVVVNADGTISAVGDTDITGDLAVTGRVGIGTVADGTYGLHIDGGASSSNLKLESTDGCKIEFADGGEGASMFIRVAGVGPEFQIRSDGESNIFSIDQTGKVTFFDTVGIGATPSNNADLLLEAGRLMLKESVTPTADTGYGKVYTKTDDKLYFQDGAGVEHTVSVADYAAIRFDDNSSAETIDLKDLYHLVTRFATNGLDEVSAADQANNRITVGVSRGYTVSLFGSAEAAGAARTFVFDVFEISQSTANITAILKATPGVVTAAGHGFSNGDLCKIRGVGGMVEVNDKIYKVAGVSGDDFDLQDDEGVSIATGGFTNYTSGGTVALATKTFAHSDRTFSNSSGFGSFSSHWYYLATSGDAMEFAIKNKSDASNLTFEHLNLTLKAL